MIVALYGIPGLSFAELTYLLTELGIGFMAVNEKPQKVGDPDKNHVVPVVFGSIRTFMQNKDKIKFRSIALVCDNYTRLRRERSWPVLGVVELSKKRHEYIPFSAEDLGAILQSADRIVEQIEVSQDLPKSYDPASEMIAKFSLSALSQTQSMMYKVKNQDVRSKTFALVRGWFLGEVKTKETLLSRLKSIHTSDKYVSDLITVVTSATALSLRRVTMESRKNPERIESLTKKANISPFDVRYLLSKGNR